MIFFLNCIRSLLESRMLVLQVSYGCRGSNECHMNVGIQTSIRHVIYKRNVRVS